MEQKPPTPSPDTPGEFDRFDSFLKKLVAVPKAEIDQQETKYKKKKAARKKNGKGK